MPRVVPGLAISIVCDLGFAVGVVSRRVPRYGDLLWMAERFYDDFPTIEEVRSIDRWRWPVFFPTGAALHRKIVDRVGVVELPDPLRPMPVLRGGDQSLGWREVTFHPDGTERVLGHSADPSMPISQIVNDVALKEMLVTNWRPADDW